MRELLKLVLNNATKKKQDSLSGLYNKLSTQLRALSSLGVTTDQCGIILYPLVENVAGKLITGRREELETGLVALETKLGWTLIGKVPRYIDKMDANMNIVTMLSQADVPVSSLWDLELLGIQDPIEQNSREETEKLLCFTFIETVRQKEDGRHEVHMPWKVDREFLTDNYELCLKRLECATRKLEKIGFREKYHEVFRECVQNNAELEIFVESATNVMKEGMFDLRGWESSAISASSESIRSPVLGLICDKNLDTLEIDSESLEFDEREKITKRKILSLVSRVFDPIGFFCTCYDST
ncbi:uncharacterized protein CEXT_413491 [Caerostris extrusa]|uniref:Uncharacterized protein n=1 Tax=Caerostris extrusa TaxID=172846 RepID=A0AAV4RVM6_CAEEX|nr:uncharacterized protein CEXT_413491 [Caerostris extrusa]